MEKNYIFLIFSIVFSIFSIGFTQAEYVIQKFNPKLVLKYNQNPTEGSDVVLQCQMVQNIIDFTSISWYKDDVFIAHYNREFNIYYYNISNEGFKIGAKPNKITNIILKSVTVNATGSYSCTFFGKDWKWASNQKYIVIKPGIDPLKVKIISHSQNIVGKEVSYSCLTNKKKSELKSVTWIKDFTTIMKYIYSMGSTYVISDIDGVDIDKSGRYRGSLYIPKSNWKTGGIYECLVETKSGEYLNGKKLITMNSEVYTADLKVIFDGDGVAGDKLMMVCEDINIVLSENDIYGIIWYQDGVEFYEAFYDQTPKFSKFKTHGLNNVFFKTHSFLEFYEIQESTSGTYSCEIIRKVTTENRKKYKIPNDVDIKYISEFGSRYIRVDENNKPKAVIIPLS